MGVLKQIAEYLYLRKPDPERIKQIKTDYAALKNLLQQEGNASVRAAQEIVSFLQTTSAPLV